MTAGAFDVPNSEAFERITRVGATILDVSITYADVTDIYLKAGGIDIWIAFNDRVGLGAIRFGRDYQGDGFSENALV